MALLIKNGSVWLKSECFDVSTQQKFCSSTITCCERNDIVNESSPAALSRGDGQSVNQSHSQTAPAKRRRCGHLGVRLCRPPPSRASWPTPMLAGSRATSLFFCSVESRRHAAKPSTFQPSESRFTQAKFRNSYSTWHRMINVL